MVRALIFHRIGRSERRRELFPVLYRIIPALREHMVGFLFFEPAVH